MEALAGFIEQKQTEADYTTERLRRNKRGYSAAKKAMKPVIKNQIGDRIYGRVSNGRQSPFVKVGEHRLALRHMPEQPERKIARYSLVTEIEGLDPLSDAVVYATVFDPHYDNTLIKFSDDTTRTESYGQLAQKENELVATIKQVGEALSELITT